MDKGFMEDYKKYFLTPKIEQVSLLFSELQNAVLFYFITLEFEIMSKLISNLQFLKIVNQVL